MFFVKTEEAFLFSLPWSKFWGFSPTKKLLLHISFHDRFSKTILVSQNWIKLLDFRFSHQQTIFHRETYCWSKIESFFLLPKNVHSIKNLLFTLSFCKNCTKRTSKSFRIIFSIRNSKYYNRNFCFCLSAGFYFLYVNSCSATDVKRAWP